MKPASTIIALIAGAIGLLSSASMEAQYLGTTNQITRHDVTWHFDKAYPYGTYVNGDYWVLGPVTITHITPDYGVFNGYTDSNGVWQEYSPARHMHGWEINPNKVVTAEETHGFDSNLAGFDATKVPGLPITISEHNTSIVKSVGLDCTGVCRPSLYTAAVLTVVTTQPSPTQFRPSYLGLPASKLVRQLSDFDLNRLPSVISTDVPSEATFNTALERQSRVKFEHIGRSQGQRMRPLRNFQSSYLPYATGDFTNSILYAITTYNQAKREEMAVHLIQHRIDWIGLFNAGYYFPRGSGEQSGGVLVPVFAATMATDDSLKQMLLTAMDQPGADALPYEEHSIQLGRQGRPLFGNALEENRYWHNLETGGGAKTIADPHGYIDGGPIPGSVYQGCCTSGWWKGMVLVFNLFPAMKQVWDFPPLEAYVQRWVYHGAWTLPDPCAPFDGNLANRGITYGPDPNNPGDCIKNGVGRFPQLHGTVTNGGSQSGYVRRLWDTYYTPDPATPPHATIIFPLDEMNVHSTVPIEVSAYAVHGMSSVQFLLNGVPLGSPVTSPVEDYPSDRAPPYRLDWNTINWPDGSYTIEARATDQNANTFTSASIRLTVQNGGNQPPTITPIGSKSVQAGQSLEFEVSATDPDGDSLAYSASGE